MKKKISLIGLVFLLIFSFAGCESKAKEAADYDQAKMQGYVNMLVKSFKGMTVNDLDKFEDMSDFGLNMTLAQSGLPIDGKSFLTMVEAWKAGVKECGAYQKAGKYTMKVTHSGAVLSAKARFADRSAELSFSFDEKMKMKSMTVNADYSTGEILEKAGLNTILGMGTVFVILIFISFIISLFKFIPAIERKWNGEWNAAPGALKMTMPQRAASAENGVSAEKAAGEASDAPTDEGELTAVIAAAIAAAGDASADGFIVRSIKRRTSNKWG